MIKLMLILGSVPIKFTTQDVRTKMCLLSFFHPKGIIEEENIDAFDAPYYAASSEELKMVIEKEGSFSIDRLEISPVDWEGWSINDESYDLVVQSKPEALASGRRVANTIRAVVEPMLEPTFGKKVMDELFERYAKIVGEYFYVSTPRYAIVIVSLVRTG